MSETQEHQESPLSDEELKWIRKFKKDCEDIAEEWRLRGDSHPLDDYYASLKSRSVVIGRARGELLENIVESGE